MNRRTVKRLAMDFKILRPAPGTAGYGTWADMVQATASAIRSENSSFDRDRFYDAAGLVR